MEFCDTCPYSDCIDSCDKLKDRERAISAASVEKVSIKASDRQEYMRLYMQRYREAHDMTTYNREYQRKRRKQKKLDAG